MLQAIEFNHTIAIGADHAGYALKEHLEIILKEWGYKVIDCGTHCADSVDYPDFVKPIVREVLNGAWGLLVCGSGVGISIGANRFKGIRAALCHDPLVARISREHNDANILVLGSRIIGEDTAVECLRFFLETPFEGGRHQRRVEKLDQLGDIDDS